VTLVTDTVGEHRVAARQPGRAGSRSATRSPVGTHTAWPPAAPARRGARAPPASRRRPRPRRNGSVRSVVPPTSSTVKPPPVPSGPRFAGAGRGAARRGTGGETVRPPDGHGAPPRRPEATDRRPSRRPCRVRRTDG